MSDPQLPVPSSQQLPAVPFESELPSAAEASPLLFIDSGTGKNSVRPGTWNYFKMPIERPTMLFFGIRTFKQFFSFKFDDKPKGAVTNPWGCASWDGENAFGYGAKIPPRGQPPTDRTCSRCPHNRPPKESHIEWCAPSYKLFGMLLHKDSDVWTPFLWDAGGLNATPAAKAYGSAFHSSRTAKRGADGTLQARRLIYSFAFQPQLTKNPGKSGYTATWGEPLDVPEADLPFIAEFMVTHGTSMWTSELASHKAHLMTLGALGAAAPQGSPRQNQTEEPGAIDDSVVPF